MKFQIFSRWYSERVVYECGLPDDTPSGMRVRAALEKATAARADLIDANLIDANLIDANLTGAYLTGADLTRANLTRANLTGANLTGANLTGADLTRANLTRANLTGANLTGAYLTGANLTRANLTRANLTGAKNDFWEILLRNQPEIEGLRAALIGGRVDGSTYSGDCACLVGTIANVRLVDVFTLKRDSSRPAERWFTAINEGDTPETNAVSKLTVEWLDEFVSLLPKA